MHGFHWTIASMFTVAWKRGMKTWACVYMTFCILCFFCRLWDPWRRSREVDESWWYCTVHRRQEGRLWIMFSIVHYRGKSLRQPCFLPLHHLNYTRTFCCFLCSHSSLLYISSREVDPSVTAQEVHFPLPHRQLFCPVRHRWRQSCRVSCFNVFKWTCSFGARKMNKTFKKSITVLIFFSLPAPQCGSNV